MKTGWVEISRINRKGKSERFSMLLLVFTFNLDIRKDCRDGAVRPMGFKVYKVQKELQWIGVDYSSGIQKIM